MGRWPRVGRLVVFVSLAYVYTTVHFGGHPWGDDFALYVNQARSLVKGDVARVVADNHFALANSGSAWFSPDVYPWGFPILLAPFVFAYGLDYQGLKILGVLSLIAFVFVFDHLLRDRLPTAVRWLLVALVALSPSYALWTDSVTSDLPYLCFAGCSLVAIDHLRRTGLLTPSARAPFVLTGLLVGYSFEIRREAVALVAALAVLQAAEIARQWWPTRHREVPYEVPWRRVALPHVTFLAFVGALQLALPSSLQVNVPNVGRQQIIGNLPRYRQMLADQIGLHGTDGGGTQVTIFGHHGIAVALLVAFLVLAVIGAAASLVRHRQRDLALIVYVVVAGYTVLVQPFREGRYIFSITPFVAYFACQAIPALAAASVRLRRAAPARGVAWGAPYASLVVLVPLVLSNGKDIAHAVDFHRQNHYVVEGPEDHDSREMFDAVRRCTRGTAVVQFSRARAMNLYTGRRSVQTGDVQLAVQRSDFLVISSSPSHYYEPPIEPSSASTYGLVRLWHDDTWSLYAVETRLDQQGTGCPPESS